MTFSTQVLAMTVAGIAARQIRTQEFEQVCQPSAIRANSRVDRGSYLPIHATVMKAFPFVQLKKHAEPEGAGGTFGEAAHSLGLIGTAIDGRAVMVLPLIKQ